MKARIPSLVLLVAVLGGVGEAQTVRQLTNTKGTGYVEYGPSAIDDDGSVAVFATSVDWFGGNPGGLWQLAAWDLASGTGEPITGFADGVVDCPASVSDDGNWIAFLSTSNPLGTNHDGGTEVFLVAADGSALRQVTDFAGPAAGKIRGVTLAGAGNRVMFTGRMDPSGTNPNRDVQIFLVESAGTGLVQVTQLAGSASEPTISDDGTRITFAHRGNPTGDNPDRSEAIFAIAADGSGLRQLAVSADYRAFPVISGNGERVAFESNQRVMTVGWNGGEIVDLAEGGGISITDDASYVYYLSDAGDTNGDIWRIDATGGVPTRITDSDPPLRNQRPTISGNGNALMFISHGGAYQGGSNPDGGPELIVSDGLGGDLRQLTEFPAYEFESNEIADIAADSGRVVFPSPSNHAGTNPDRTWEIYRIEADGSGLAQVTDFGGDSAVNLSVTADGQTIVFHSFTDLLDDGCDHGGVYRVLADGIGLIRLSEPCTTFAGWPDIAADGGVVVYQGGSTPHALHRVDPDGTNGALIVDDGASVIKNPRVSADGQWVVYHTPSDIDGLNPNGYWQVVRARTDGSRWERVTLYPEHSAMTPDISADGGRIVYRSSADPLGSNGDNNLELYLYEPATAATTQLTFTVGGANSYPRISDDGAVVYFKSSSAIFEANPDGHYEPYRMSVETGVVERVGALKKGHADMGVGSLRFFESIVPDRTGQRAVFWSRGDWTDDNPDRGPEVWRIDFEDPAIIRVGPSSPTVVRWSPEPAPRTYDVIRGDVADLSETPGGTVDLGPVMCLEDDSPDTNTDGFEDTLQPEPGRVLFYLYRGSQGSLAGTGSWGEGSTGAERVATIGDCPG